MIHYISYTRVHDQSYKSLGLNFGPT